MTYPTTNAPAAARRRLAGYRAGQHIDHLREDQALNNTLGQGIGYGFAAAAAELAPEFVALRLAGGLRWAGATRAAVVAARVATRLTEQASWAGAEGELIGGRAAWQGLRAKPGAFAKDFFIKGTADYGVQVTANGVTGNDDPFLDINGLETLMAAYGIRPVGIGIGSAAVNINLHGQVKTVLHTSHRERVYPGTFAAQAFIGVGMGYLGHGADRLLGATAARLAQQVAEHAALRVGPRLAYPVGVGLSNLVPHLLGTTEEALEGTADTFLTPKDTTRAASPRR